MEHLIRIPDALLSHAQALFCQVPPHHVLTMHDVSNIWRVPLLMAEQDAHRTVCTALALDGADQIDLREWKAGIADRWDTITAQPVGFILPSVHVGMAGF